MSDPNTPKKAIKTPKMTHNAHQSLEAYKKNAKQHKLKGALSVGGKNDAWRFSLIWLFMLAGCLILVSRAYYLQVANSEFYIKKSEEFITSKRTVPVSRGMIKDTNGVPLAANAPLVTVVFSPQDYARAYYLAKKNVQTARSEKGRQNAAEKLAKFDLEKLAEASGYSLEGLRKAVNINDTINPADDKAVEKALPKGAGSQRLVLMNRTTPEAAAAVRALKFAGVNEEVQSRRFYLQAEPMAQVVGYMANSQADDIYKGRAGIEGQYDEMLSGEAGQILVLKNADQYALKQLEEIKPATLGKDVHLTIDARLQYVLYKELEQVGREQSARWASGIIVDIPTGDVLAMGAWPSFNSNKLSERTGANERNRAVLDAFEPGSVIKPFTVAAALESGRYNKNTLIDTGGGAMRLPGYTIRDGGAYGAIPLSKLIQKSSNVASAKIALNLPVTAMVDMQRRFGFGQKTALNFPAEASGSIITPKASEQARRATLSYGYGQQVTLAQIAQAYAALGAGGQLRPLRLVKDDLPREKPTQVISEAHAREIVNMMELVTMQGGTGKEAAIDGYRVAGKTGTSRRYSPELKRYAEGQYRTIFAGVAPASEPRFAVAILVEDPRRQFYAGPVSGPVFSRVMREALRLYDVPMDKPLETKAPPIPKA